MNETEWLTLFDCLFGVVGALFDMLDSAVIVEFDGGFDFTVLHLLVGLLICDAIVRIIEWFRDVE